MNGVVTGQTCGDACWHAREDECRCSCGGVNHGCLRNDDGTEQPARTSRIKGKMYRFYAVGTYGEMAKLMSEMKTKCREFNIAVTERWSGYMALDQDAFIEKAASKDQVARWSELKEAREGRVHTRTLYNGETITRTIHPRHVLWVRQDVIEALEEKGAA